MNVKARIDGTFPRPYSSCAGCATEACSQTHGTVVSFSVSVLLQAVPCVSGSTANKCTHTGCADNSAREVQELVSGRGREGGYGGYEDLHKEFKEYDHCGIKCLPRGCPVPWMVFAVELPGNQTVTPPLEAKATEFWLRF